MVITGRLGRPAQRLGAEVEQITTIGGRIGRSSGGSAPLYAGPYEVTPIPEEQRLNTSGRLMTDDVTIKEIPYFDVGNTAGGSTVYIGVIE